MDYLDRLSTILNYQLSTTLLLILTYAGGLTILIATIAAIIFSPYMLYALYLEKKYGWMTFFVILVLIPILVLFLSTLWELLFLPLTLAYFYYFLLKFVVRDWIQERNARMAFQEQLRESSEKHQEEENLNFFISE